MMWLMSVARPLPVQSSTGPIDWTPTGVAIAVLVVLVVAMFVLGNGGFRIRKRPPRSEQFDKHFDKAA